MTATIILGADDPKRFRFLTVGGFVGMSRRNFESFEEAEAWSETKTFENGAAAVEWVIANGYENMPIAIYSDD